MKAALNGVLNLSINDGWWVEGYQMNPKSGWVIGGPPENYVDESRWQQFQKEDADSLYNILNDQVIPAFFNTQEWIHMQKEAPSLISYFNTHRVVLEQYKRAIGLNRIVQRKEEKNYSPLNHS
jgi:starch phosphorylase